MMRRLAFAVSLCAALAGCAGMESEGDAALAIRGRTTGGGAADALLEADREFSAKSLESGVPAAFFQFMDEHGMQLPAVGEAVTGRANVRAALAQGPPILMSWEPRYAEILEGDWGWTWGEWQAHEPGAGGKLISQGKYVNLWRKQADGTWKVRLDIGNTVRKP